MALAAGVRADDRVSTDDLDKLFERGGTSDEFKSKFQLKLEPLTRLAQEAAAPFLPKRGRYVASYGPVIQNNLNYPEMQRLLGDSRFPSLPPVDQEAFKAEAGNRADDRTALLGRSDKLDDEDETLFWDGKRLTQRANDLNAERDRLNADIDRFNQFCVGRTLPPGDYQYCLNERGRLQRWQTDLGQRVASHNQEESQWEGRLSPLRAAAAAIEQDIQRWDGLIKDLINRLNQALARIGQCQALELEYKKACRNAKPCDATTGCPDLAANMRNNGNCAKAADELNQQCHGGSNQDLSERAEAARKASAACAALFKQKCGRWVSPETGLCLEDRHRLLQTEVDTACALPRSCQGVDYQDCDKLNKLFDNGTDCYNARKKIMVECFEGGDSDHKRTASLVLADVAFCESRIKLECRPSGIFERR